MSEGRHRRPHESETPRPIRRLWPNGSSTEPASPRPGREDRPDPRSTSAGPDGVRQEAPPGPVARGDLLQVLQVSPPGIGILVELVDHPVVDMADELHLLRRRSGVRDAPLRPKQPGIRTQSFRCRQSGDLNDGNAGRIVGVFARHARRSSPPWPAHPLEQLAGSGTRRSRPEGFRRLAGIATRSLMWAASRKRRPPYL